MKSQSAPSLSTKSPPKRILWPSSPTAQRFSASVAQDFSGIGAETAAAVSRVLAGEDINQSVIYVPTVLVTTANVADFLDE